MKYIEHYRRDNELMDYEGLPAHEKGRMYYRYMLISRMLGSGSILDIGSADGLLAQFTGRDYISVDISQVNNSNNRKAIEGDILNLPLGKGVADNIVVSETLEHITNIDRCIDEVYAVLKNNGILIISVPNNEQIQYTLCIHCNKSTPLNAHLHSFTADSLNALLEKHGFIITDTVIYENKLLNLFQFFSMTGKMPYFIMRGIDYIAKYFFNKYNKLIIKAQKGQ